MNVKAFLAKEDGDFVSLDAVLRGMMRANDCNYQEAAITILRLMVREDFPAHLAIQECSGRGEGNRAGP